MIPDSEYTYSSGWNLQNVHRGRINNYGYASPQDYRADPDGHRVEVAVFGDSYVEALMNEYPDTLPGLLGERLDHAVLNFGMSGAEMPDYLGISSLVRSEFTPEWAVYVITAGDFTRGFAAAPGYFEWDPARSPPIRLVPEIHRSARSKFLRTVGLVRYLRGNLLLRPGELIQWRRAVEPPSAGTACRHEVLSRQDTQLIDAFVTALPEALQLPPGRMILVFDADRRRIYREGISNLRPGPAKPPCLDRSSLALERLAARARWTGMHVVDTEPLFRRHFTQGLGPLDRAPLDAHWNPAAHRLVARAVADIIETGESSP
jgi:hypothetical protein